MTQFGRDFESAYSTAVLGIQCRRHLVGWGGTEGASLFFYNVAITVVRVNIGNTRVEYTNYEVYYSECTRIGIDVDLSVN